MIQVLMHGKQQSSWQSDHVLVALKLFFASLKKNNSALFLGGGGGGGDGKDYKTSIQRVRKVFNRLISFIMQAINKIIVLNIIL